MKKYNNLYGLRVHFIGIGGISMSGLASIVLSRGGFVQGSDLNSNKEIDRLVSMGACFLGNHDEKNIDKSIDLVVYSSAISSDNPELKRSKDLNIKIMERAEFLGLIASTYQRTIAVAGTHGKTTTTAMISEIFTLAGLNPTIHLGGESIGLKGNTIIGGEKYFIVEACEYKESFRFLYPYIGLITNIEADHLDYYKDYNDIRNAFLRFASRSTSLISLCQDNIEHEEGITIFGDWEARNIEFIYNGYSFNVYFKKQSIGTFRINMLGIHNVTNALFSIATAYLCGIDIDIIERALANFQGVERRYETVRLFDSGCRVIIDYAHHPTELKASIEGLKDVYSKALYVFQPHTYSRTLRLFSEFLEILEPLDNLIIFDTYPAREEVVIGGRAIDLYEELKLRKNKKNSVQNLQYFDSVEDLDKFIINSKKDFDCILVLGAGDLAEKLKRKYANA